jgi:hypothetical protein
MLTVAEKQQAAVKDLVASVVEEIGNLKGVIVNLQKATTQTGAAAKTVSEAAGQVAGAAATAAANGARQAVAPAVKDAFTGVAKEATAAIDAASAPILERIQGIHHAASGAETAISRMGEALGKKAVMFAATGVAITWLFGLGGVLWQNYELKHLVEAVQAAKVDMAEMQANVAALEAKGGRIKLFPGQCGGRLCVEASADQGKENKGWAAPWGVKGAGVGYVIPNGY